MHKKWFVSENKRQRLLYFLELYFYLMSMEELINFCALGQFTSNLSSLEV